MLSSPRTRGRFRHTAPEYFWFGPKFYHRGRILVANDEGWSRLPEHWRCAFRQAWAAYIAGTIPVGAVVVDPHGMIAAEARNRIFDAGDPPRSQLAGSWLAHAELNAIAQIDTERSRVAEGWAVYSTWEPCPLCAGAITVAFRGRITVGYACRDPISSGLRVLTDTDIGRRRQWQVQQLRGPFAVFAELLLAVYTVEARPTSLTAARYRRPPWRPLIETAGVVLAKSRDRGEAVEQAVATSWAALQRVQVDTASDASA
jgi:tRNA(adenine34) deaminase